MGLDILSQGAHLRHIFPVVVSSEDMGEFISGYCGMNIFSPGIEGADTDLVTIAISLFYVI